MSRLIQWLVHFLIPCYFASPFAVNFQAVHRVHQSLLHLVVGEVVRFCISSLLLVPLEVLWTGLVLTRRTSMSGMGDGYVGTAQDAVRIRRLEKQREAERRKIQELKTKSASAKGQPGLLQFGSSTSEVWIWYSSPLDFF